MKRILILMLMLLGSTHINAQTMDVSCLYETLETNNKQSHSHHIADKSAVKWYFWRTTNDIEVSNAGRSFGEKWTLTDKNEVIYQALYHDKKFLLDFQPADLKILDRQSNWGTKRTLIPKRLLSVLTITQQGEFKGYKMVRYEGKYAGDLYQIDWLTELDLPAKVTKKALNTQVTIELKEIFPLTKSPYKQVDTEKYDDMDYADIGDNESHPIVAQLQKTTGIGYFHQH